MTNPTPLKEGLQQLANLAGIEIEIGRIQESLDSIPFNLKELGAKLNLSLKTLEEKKQALEKTQAEAQETEKGLEESKELLKVRETKLYEIKTTKEYQAAQKEIASARKSNIDREIKLPELKQRLESLGNEVAALETETQALQAKMQEEESRIGGELEGLRRQLEEKLAAKQGIFGDLDKALVGKYEKVLARKKPAMAPVLSGVCQECNINIPPQLYIEIQKHLQVINCPSCFRILYIPSS